MAPARRVDSQCASRRREARLGARPRDSGTQHPTSSGQLRWVGTMTLIVDTASAARRLGAAEFQRWADTRTIFLSSEMRDLSALRGRVAGALRDAGFSVVVFEDLGGRDEDAERAYL